MQITNYILAAKAIHFNTKFLGSIGNKLVWEFEVKPLLTIFYDVYVSRLKQFHTNINSKIKPFNGNIGQCVGFDTIEQC